MDESRLPVNAAPGMDGYRAASGGGAIDVFFTCRVIGLAVLRYYSCTPDSTVLKNIIIQSQRFSGFMPQYPTILPRLTATGICNGCADGMR